jgi:hypothetical protein
MDKLAHRISLDAGQRPGDQRGCESREASPLHRAYYSYFPDDRLRLRQPGGHSALKGRVSFNILQHNRSQAQAILFYAFDVIIHRGRRLIHVPLETRRELLSDITADLKTRTPLIGLSDTLMQTQPS